MNILIENENITMDIKSFDCSDNDNFTKDYIINIKEFEAMKTTNEDIEYKIIFDIDVDFNIGDTIIINSNKFSVVQKLNDSIIVRVGKKEV
ncbi:MAG: hypothetical protein ACRCVJ_18495 [Clostridium sp.]|uniref:hypothetical protein n=1 Tax=Clostridium sp. TaxID=1506 RepID=UPI003F371630